MKTQKVSFEAIAKTLRSASAGTSFGAALAIGAHVFIPSVRSTGISPEQAAALGMVLGATLQRGLAPYVRCVDLYRRMAEITLATRMGWMSEAEATEFRAKLLRRYHLGQLR